MFDKDDALSDTISKLSKSHVNRIDKLILDFFGSLDNLKEYGYLYEIVEENSHIKVDQKGDVGIYTMDTTYTIRPRVLSESILETIARDRNKYLNWEVYKACMKESSFVEDVEKAVCSRCYKEILRYKESNEEWSPWLHKSTEDSRCFAYRERFFPPYFPSIRAEPINYLTNKED